MVKNVLHAQVMNMYCVNASSRAKMQQMQCYAVVSSLLIQVVRHASYSET